MNLSRRIDIRRLFPHGLLLLASLALPASSAAAEYWRGEANAGAERTIVELRFDGPQHRPRVRLGLPDMGVSAWPADAVRQQGRRWHIRFPADAGAQTMVLRAEGDRLVGDWQEVGQQPARLVLRRQVAPAGPGERRLLLRGPAGRLGVSLFLPARRSAAIPGVVFLHGSGAQPREASRFAAERLAAAGVATLIFDKRGVGESEGDWRSAGLEDLAADAAALADWLGAQAGVAGVGFIGQSQGAWVAPLAAKLRPSSRFLILLSGPAVGPVREAQWETVRALRAVGAAPAVVEEARGLIEHWFRAVRSEAASDWARFDSVYAQAGAQSWFAESRLQAFAQRPEPGLAAWIRRVADFEPLPLWRSIGTPSLWLLSPDDESIDALETLSLLENLRVGGAPISVKRYPGFDHGLRRLGHSGSPPRWPAQPADLLSTQRNFIRAVMQRRR